MNAKKVIVVGLVIAAAVLAIRRAGAATTRAPLELVPLPLPELGPIHVGAGPPLVIAGVPYIAPPPPTLLERAVDQVKDALKGLGLWSKKVPAQYRELFAMTGAQYRLPPGLLEAVAYRESRFRADIIDGRLPSSAGALGIMQIVPKWHPEVGAQGALDPLRAVPYAARFLRSLFEQFGSWKLAVAAYNAGPAAVKKYGGVPPFAETQAYVAEIAANAGLA